MQRTCRFHGTGFHPCQATADTSRPGHWATQGYCELHADMLERQTCVCKADEFFLRDLSANTRASYPATCGYCRARAADPARN
jgi:hypothetical protein